MKRILLVGGGNAGERYAESLLWRSDMQVTICGFSIVGKAKELSRNFGLDYIQYEQLCRTNISTFDCAIITVPIEAKRAIVGHIINDCNFRGGMILEKPLCICEEDLMFYRTNLQLLDRCAVVCQRDYLTSQYSIPKSDNFVFWFPCTTSDEIFNVTHNMPHVLSLLYTVSGSMPILKHEDCGCWEGLWQDKPIKIKMIDKEDNPQMRVNDLFYPAVNYRKIDAEIVNKVCCSNRAESAANLEKAYAVSINVIKLLKEIGGISVNETIRT